MKTVFKVGMKVYDNIFFPNSKGEVVRIDEHYDCERVIVRFDNWDYDASYTEKGRLVATYKGATPTLSTKPYTLQGFEQKAPAPTYEEAIKEAHRKDEYYYLPNDLEAPSKELADAAVALLKLLFLRDYYNEGWQPDLKNKEQRGTAAILDSKNVFFVWDVLKETETYALVFKDRKTAKRFLEEQRELLEIAKPLL